MSRKNVEDFTPSKLWMEILIAAADVNRMHMQGNMIRLDHASTELAHLVKLFDDYIYFDDGEIKYTEAGRNAAQEVEAEEEVSYEPLEATESTQCLTDSMVVDVITTIPEDLPSPPPVDNNELLFRLCEYVEALDENGSFNESLMANDILREYRQSFFSKLTEARDDYSNRHVRRPNIKYVCSSCKREVGVLEFRNHKCHEDVEDLFMVPELVNEGKNE